MRPIFVLEEAAVKRPTRLILLIGFGTLVVLVGILGFSAFRRAEQIYRDVSSIHETYQKSSSTLYDIQTDTLYSGILVRDHLLDALPVAGPQYRKDLLEIRSAMEKHLTNLSGLVSPEETDAFKRLRRELDVYWDSLDPIFDWTPIQKTAQSSWFLKNEILPRRKAILSITQEIDALSANGFKREQNKIRSAKDGLRELLAKYVRVCLMLCASGFRNQFFSNLAIGKEIATGTNPSGTG